MDPVLIDHGCHVGSVESAPRCATQVRPIGGHVRPRLQQHSQQSGWPAQSHREAQAAATLHRGEMRANRE